MSVPNRPKAILYDMPTIHSMPVKRLFLLLAGLLVVKVTGSVVLNYRSYFPPDFESDFLHGRELYFWGSYHWAFYAHLVTGPVTLILGMLLLSDRFRLRFPQWHRRFGRVQAALVLLAVVPSGLWMASRAETGPIAALGFAILAVLTAGSILLGWKTAVRRRFAEHRRWMWRCYLLLCSTVVLRLLSGLATVTGVQAVWYDLLITWASWILPLTAFEFLTRRAWGVSPPMLSQPPALPADIPATEIPS